MLDPMYIASVRPITEVPERISKPRPMRSHYEHADKLEIFTQRAQEFYDNNIESNKYTPTSVRVRRNPDETTRYVTHWTINPYPNSCDMEFMYDFLAEQNVEKVGSGNYSMVVDCPWDDNSVIKIGYGDLGNGDYMNDGWVSWAAFCMTVSPNGEHKELPLIRHIVFKDDLFCAVIKRYAGTVQNIDTIEYESLAQYTEVRESMAALKQQDSKICISSMREYSKVYAPRHVIDRINLWATHPDVPRCTDTHSQNMMVDLDNNCVVLTDPSSQDYKVRSAKVDIFKQLGLWSEDKD